LNDTKIPLQDKFSELGNVALSTVWNTVIKLNYKWQSFGLTQPADRETSIKECIYGYYKEFFKCFEGEYTRVSIEMFK